MNGRPEPALINFFYLVATRRPFFKPGPLFDKSWDHAINSDRLGIVAPSLISPAPDQEDAMPE